MEGNGTTDRSHFPPTETGSQSWFNLLLVVIILASLLPLGMLAYHSYARSTFTYTLDTEALILRYGLTQIQIPYHEIQGVRHVTDPQRLRRVRGTSIAGLQTGWFSLQGYGRVYRLTTTGQPLVYVDTRDDAVTAPAATRYVISPAESRNFASSLSRRVQRGSGQELVYGPAPGPSPAYDPLLILAAVMTLPVAIGIPLYVVRGRDRLGYGVAAEGIEIHHPFSVQTIPWQSIHEVRRIDRQLSGLRTMGTAMPGYYAGNFQITGKGGVKVYASTMSPPLVLLRTRIGMYLLSPADADGFLAAAAPYLDDEPD